MGKYNSEFKLNVRDIELIEEAIREKMAHVSRAQVTQPNAIDPAEVADIRACNEVLGKLSNQKRWYSQAILRGVPSG